jgi:hypothetical protein
MHRNLLGALIAAAVAVGTAGAASAATAHGKLEKVDASGRTIVVKEGKQSQTFSVGADAKVMDGAKAISLDQLKSGEVVKVEYTDQGGKHVASKVTHKPPTAAKAKGAAKPAASQGAY